MNPTQLDFSLSALRRAYHEKLVTPEDVLREALRRAADTRLHNAWITLFPEATVLDFIKVLRDRDPAALPLYGVPFAVKDNIDLAGVATTCACRALEGPPAVESATIVARLIAAGAIPVGKTNLDQFATGLVGVRSPYGACSSVFDANYISGGSSSGSAVSVAAGAVTFALGTDTAGSGRVPAAFNNIVGLKPTRGVLSTHGVFPACRSLDCVSVFAGSAHDAGAVLDVGAAPDSRDCYSRPLRSRTLPPVLRIGVPSAAQLEFFGDDEAAALFAATLGRLKELGHTLVEIDYAPFADAAALLYAGPWVAERKWATEKIFAGHPESFDPVVGAIISGADKYTAVDTFAAMYALQEHRLRAGYEWEKMDVLLLPTTGTTYTLEQVRAAPVALNSNLGRYTNFVNLFDLAAVAVPAGLRGNGLPFGVSFIGPAHTDHALLALGDTLHRFTSRYIGATPFLLAHQPPPAASSAPRVTVAVVGAHLRGLPLNYQLTALHARFLGEAQTAPHYRLYRLADGKKPGLLRTPDMAQAHGIAVELWSLDAKSFGEFVSIVPPPLGIGNVQLEDGREVKGFICEPYALCSENEITQHGGWRAWLAVKDQESPSGLL
ncbi:MAG: allophanate hydrolase [Puniceicoccales bacterium]|jgi:allophanate hydrolase|nr:allophanate hydrolase [Puniceicoccales bacterium]